MPESGAFRVSVSKDELVFSSAHFITFAGHRCEGLHGHNYRVRVTVDGPLDHEIWLVIDFVELKRVVRALCQELDHKVLLPQGNPRITVTEKSDSVDVAVDGKRRYMFPREDCAIIPVPNTTVEMLAQMLTDRLRTRLEAHGAHSATSIEVEVEENFGQSAVYRLTIT